MRYLAEPGPLADALAALIDKHYSRDFREMEAEYRPADQPASEWDHAVAALEAADTDAHVVPVIESYGLPAADLDKLLSLVDDLVRVLSLLRSGTLVLDGHKDRDTLAEISAALVSVGRELAPRVNGVIAALVDAHYEAGGTHPELAAALGEKAGTVAKRSVRRRVSGPDEWERWALGIADEVEHPAVDLRPGWLFRDPTGRQRQVQTVSVYADGMAEVNAGGPAAFSYEPGAAVPAVFRLAPVQRTVGTVTVEGRDVGVTTYTRARGVAPVPAAS